MKRAFFIKFVISICVCLAAFGGVFAQTGNAPKVKNPEVLEEDKTPAIIKHLPEWETVQNRAVYTLNTDDLRKALGARSVFDVVTLGGGVEAVTAAYPQGKLLIVEYPTPQASSDADGLITQKLKENPPVPPVYYRRIGNYSAFVFDAGDEPAASALLDQIKYEKTIQWLGEDPIPALRAERAFAIGTGELFLSTLIMVVVGFGSTILAGLIIGLTFFYIREQKRATTHIFTDAGGMTRLNLDGLTPDVMNDRLLSD
ncbi:MAG TPA: hypothetical protein VGC76_12955 [Pyrinomonadaceae bacterium]